MSLIEIKSEKIFAGINTLGSELTYIRDCNGENYLWDGDEKVWSLRAPVLFPICGGLKDGKYLYKGKYYTLPKHGFAMNSEFIATKKSESKAELTFFSNEKTLENYPFKFCFKIVFEVIDQALKISYSVKNIGDERMYFSIGAHEGYACPKGIEEYEIRFDESQVLDSYILTGELLENNSQRIVSESRILPLKEEYFKVDALVFKNIKFKKVTLARKNGKEKVSVEFDQARYFLLWTKTGAKYICLEPWCGIQDIVGSSYDLEKKEGIISLDPNKEYTFNHTIKCFI